MNVNKENGGILENYHATFYILGPLGVLVWILPLTGEPLSGYRRKKSKALHEKKSRLLGSHSIEDIDVFDPPGPTIILVSME